MKRRSRQLLDQMPDRVPNSVSCPSTSLRRSPRLLHRNHPPQSPDSKTPRSNPDNSLRRSPRFLPRNHSPQSPDCKTPRPNPDRKARARHQPVENPKKSAKSGNGSRGPGNRATGLRQSPRLSVRAEKSPECAKKGEANRRSTRLSSEVKDMRKERSGCAEKRPQMGTRCCVLGLAAAVEKKVGREADHKTQGVKRKREAEASGSEQGWTKEQEAALERAYLAAKVTPSFWKKVSKLVPGKSAQECFDKFNSDLPTPQPRSRSRAAKTRTSQSERSPLSASKILEPVKPTNKTSRRRKMKSHIVQRTVRQLLQKHCQMDQTAGADLFSILEPNVNSSAKILESSSILSTPETAGKKQGFLYTLRERTSSSKKPLSRFHGSGETGKVLISPPVLKPVKNRALHEKYLDQLHSREARRNVASAGNKILRTPKVDVVRAAKEALVSDVRDAIHRLQDFQDSPNSGSRDLDDDYGADEDEDDDVNNGC
ncbi:uncharacterized protein LOC116194822 [Punica granatum]|uniref:Myb-like domain-containing protein n=2 Tax=Punica granatum TaxID=22663 RepID=A0A218XKW0_PUNGR|nr:uncharacterized protein LOC116194822 [Punica granatum]OWM85438.1 hypothetical protein CDL15_Pgr019062 [Punica granatum]PKI42070.1 hypothetical protein CRG98_037523 [Punica granatum]